MPSHSARGTHIIDESYRNFFAAIRTSEMLEAAARASDAGLRVSPIGVNPPLAASAAVLGRCLNRGLEGRLKDIVTPDPECISLDASLSEAAKKMRASGVGILLLSQQDCLVGAVTDRDIVVRAVAEGLDPLTTTLRQIMA